MSRTHAASGQAPVENSDPGIMSGGGGNWFPVVPHLAGKVAQNANHHFCRPIENRRADLRPFPPRAICPLGPGLGGGQKPKGRQGHPGRHDGLPGAGLRCTFAQRGWFGGFHDGSAMLRSQSEQSKPWTYAWTADMRAGRPGRPEPSRHCMRAAAVSAFSWGFVHIVRRCTRFGEAIGCDSHAPRGHI